MKGVAIRMDTKTGEWGFDMSENLDMFPSNTTLPPDAKPTHPDGTPADVLSNLTMRPDSEYSEAFLEFSKRKAKLHREYKPKCYSDDAEAKKKLSAFHSGEISDKVMEFCKDKSLWDTKLIPRIGFGTGFDTAGKRKAVAIGRETNIHNGQDRFQVGMYFNRDTCTGSQMWPPGKDDEYDERYYWCHTRLFNIIHGCDTGGAGDKWGGKLQEDCLVYYVKAHPISELDTNDSPGLLGEVQCSQSDKDKCQCWYEKQPNVFEVFAKPTQGCQWINKAPTYMYDEQPDPEKVSYRKNDPLLGLEGSTGAMDLIG